MYIYHFNKWPQFCEITPIEELLAKMYLSFLDLFIKMCLMMVRVNRNMYHSVCWTAYVVCL